MDETKLLKQLVSSGVAGIARKGRDGTELEAARLQ